jgi:adenylate cyclase
MEHPQFKRRLKAILLADVVGYSRLMNLDEAGTHVKVNNYTKDLIEPKIAGHGGRLIRTMGDGFLAEFDSAADAVASGLEIQEGLRTDNAVGSDPRIWLRIGINTGDVIADDGDIYGHSVNIAARLEGLAEPGEVYVTRAVRDQLEGQLGLSFEDRGERRVKNIARPIRIYRVKCFEREPTRSPLDALLAHGRRLLHAPFALQQRSVVLSTILLSVTVTLSIGALPIRLDYSRPPNKASIMVAPFRNSGNDPDQDYVADAITDNLTTDLSRLSNILVISRATAFTFKGEIVDPRDIGRDLGVRYLLEGSVTKTGLKVQTNAQLIDTQSAAQIWADRFDNEVTDLFALQQAVTSRIASTLNLQPDRAKSRRTIADKVVDPEAADLRLRAMALLIHWFEPNSTSSARQSFEESVRRDPQSAETWAQLANVLLADYLNRWNDAEKDPVARENVVRRAEEAVEEALKLDPSVALAHYASGFIRRIRGDHQGALDSFERALGLDPNFAGAYAQKANELVFLGRADEAAPWVTKAIRLSPRDPSMGVFYWILGRAYFVARNYNDAIIWLRKSVELRPNLWFNRAHLVSAYKLAGNDQEASAALNEFNNRFNGYDLAHITSIYNNDSYQDGAFRASLQELYKGLRLAGMS